jgi:DNA repair protein RadC
MLIKNIATLTGITESQLEKVVNKVGYSNLLKNANVLNEFSIPETKINKFELLINTFLTWREEITLQEVTTLDSSKKAVALCEGLLKGKKKEEFYIIFLDTQNNVLGNKCLFKGTVNECAIYIREVVTSCLNFNATSIIICHNHPAGSIKPSQADIAVTGKISKALETIDIKVLDHVIIGNGSYSFAENGKI